MNDISTQIQAALKDIIKRKLESVSPVVGNYKKLDDLRIILGSTFPKEKEKTFKNNESTKQFLRRILSEDDVIFKDRTVDNKNITVYSVPNRSDGSKSGNQYNDRPNRLEGLKNGNPANDKPKAPEARNVQPANGKPKSPEARNVQPANGKPKSPEAARNVQPANDKPKSPEAARNVQPVNDKPKAPEAPRNRKQDNGEPNTLDGIEIKKSEVGKDKNQKAERPATANSADNPVYFKSDLKKFAFFPDIEGTLGRIAGMAKPEVWAFGEGNGRSQYPILEAYLSQVIVRLKYEKEVLGHSGKIVIVQYVEKDKEGKSIATQKCAINTGLVSRRGNFIYLLFDKNNRPDAQDWVFRQVSDDTRSQSFLPFSRQLPERADFYQSASRSIVTYTKNVESINVGHILLTHCERIPIDFLKRHFGEYFKSPDVLLKTKEDWDRFKKYISDPAQSYELEVASQMLQICIEKAERDAQSDDSRKVNIYRPSEHKVGFFLPLYLVKPKDDKDFEVGVIIDKINGSYVARTIYRTSMAYPRIRVMGNHNRSWLDPTRISNWRDPYKEVTKKQK